MKRLLFALLLAGCMTKPDPVNRPMPTCSTESECAAKMATAQSWLLGHNYQVHPNDKGLRATSKTVMLSIEKRADVLYIEAACAPDMLRALGLSGGCNADYEAVYDLSQAMR